jgi:hypothetical protein
MEEDLLLSCLLSYLLPRNTQHNCVARGHVSNSMSFLACHMRLAPFLRPPSVLFLPAEYSSVVFDTLTRVLLCSPLASIGWA